MLAMFSQVKMNLEQTQQGSTHLASSILANYPPAATRCEELSTATPLDSPNQFNKTQPNVKDHNPLLNTEDLAMTEEANPAEIGSRFFVSN